jgi:hypothetical protein
MIKEGEKVRSNLNGKGYEVKAIKNRLVVLDAEDGLSWLITDKDILRMFYMKVENETREDFSDLSLDFRSAASNRL